MFDGQILGVAALVVSLLALIISAAFGARQILLMRNANYVPVLIDLLGQFRSLEFNDNYHFVCTRLAVEHEPASGISSLPDEVRAKIFDVAYYFQLFATLAALRVVRDDHIIPVIRDRVVQVWDAIEPFVLAERESTRGKGPSRFRNLEDFAKTARRMQRRPTHRFMLSRNSAR